MRLAVYGSLRRGGVNHHYLDQASFLGQMMMSNLLMVNLGPYPAAVLSPKSSDQAVIELYEINEQTLTTIDLLEEYIPNQPEKSLYIRQTIQTQYGETMIYLYNQSITSYPVIADFMQKN